MKKRQIRRGGQSLNARKFEGKAIPGRFTFEQSIKLPKNHVLRIIASNQNAQDKVRIQSKRIFIDCISDRTLVMSKNRRDQTIEIKTKAPNSNIEETVCILELSPKSTFGKKRFLKFQESERPSKIAGALSEIYHEESKEIDDFAKAMTSLSNSKGAIQRSLAKMQAANRETSK